ncbi:hypothetical protein D3C78_990730 [compost metagenome]
MVSSEVGAICSGFKGCSILISIFSSNLVIERLSFLASLSSLMNFTQYFASSISAIANAACAVLHANEFR